jgi:RNA-directed DNA polymerase
MIPKPDGRERPLGIASLEDKIVQRALVEVLNEIYEGDLGFSYGFRPGRSQHNALGALYVGINKMAAKWVLDADIRSFFDTVDHNWLIRFVEYRVGDERVLRLIRKWLKAGVMQDGLFAATEIGTPQGAVISPLLANIYLHYVFDLWARQWRQRIARGHVIVVRYADDIVCGFEHEADAIKFLPELRARMKTFLLSLHPEKTRLIEFGRFAVTNRERRGLGRPGTFTFLGFTHICSRDRRGWFLLVRKTRRGKMHEPIPEQGRWLGQVVRGYFAYHAIPTNLFSLRALRHYVTDAWRRTLSRRSQRGRVNWDMMPRLAGQWLPMPRILHPGPINALPSCTQGGSRVRELRLLGSVRGVRREAYPYRDHADALRHSVAEVSIREPYRDVPRDHARPFASGGQLARVAFEHLTGNVESVERTANPI